MIYGLRSALVPSEIEPIKYFSFECLVLLCTRAGCKKDRRLLGFTHFHCHKDVVDLDPGSPYEDMSFSHGGIHAGVRMCEIVACGLGPS